MASTATQFTLDIDILQIAQESQLRLRQIGRRSVQYKTDCPFCGDQKQNLELNGEKNVFHCWVCGTGGGLIRFYALLHDVSEHTAKETLFPSRTGRARFNHPALHLSQEQLKRIGFTHLPNQKPSSFSNKQWFTYRKRTLDWVWSEWKQYQAWEQRFTQRFERLLAEQP